MNPAKRSFLQFTKAPLFVRYLSSKTQQNVADREEIKPRLLKVAIIGMPNVGKSTLINALMDRKVCPTSSKVHTTKKKSLAIFTENEAQVVFLDTPGLVTNKEVKKFNLARSFYVDGRSSLQQANIIGVVHDVSDPWTRERIDIKILRLLEDHLKKPSFLVLNKVDLIKHKRKLLDLTRKLTENRLEGELTIENLDADEDDLDVVRGWSNFREIFMVSSLTGNGLEELRNFLLSQAKPSPWMFPPEQFSNNSPEEIIVNTVRAKLLDALPQEVPYLIQPKMELFEIGDDGKMTAVVIVECPAQRYVKLICGGGDERLRTIIAQCQSDLQNVFQCFVRLRIVPEAKEKIKK